MALAVAAQDAQRPLPIYIEDNHAGSFQFLATTLDLDRPYALVLVDAHSDATVPWNVSFLRRGIRRVKSAEEREARLSGWRRHGDVQAFDWVAPLMPRPVEQVLWIRPGGAGPADRGRLPLPHGYLAIDEEHLESSIRPDLPVVVSLDLDSFSGMPAVEQASRFNHLWARMLRLPRLSAITVAISRPWLVDDAEAFTLLTLALKAGLALAHAEIRIEPFGLEGPDRSERAKMFYRLGKEAPRFDPETASRELRSLLLANVDRLQVRFDPERWKALLARWRAETSDWKIVLEGVEPGSDGIFRPEPGSRPDLRLEGGPPGAILRVTWVRWVPEAWSYNVLPELPSGKVFAGVSPPVMAFVPAALASTQSAALGPEVWEQALPGPSRTGVLRISAEVETAAGVVHTARVELRAGIGSGFHEGLAEQFGLPYVFGAGFLRRGALRGPDTGVGNDCANFLVSAWRRSGLRMPWCNPSQLKRHLSLVVEHAKAGDALSIPPDALARGLVIHLGSHVAALWEDREPIGTLGPEDLVVHHLGGAPEVLSLRELLQRRGQDLFAVYLGPPREPVAWVALGGDLMPGDRQEAGPGLKDLLSTADLAVANLETTAGSRGGTPARKRYVFQVPPGRLGAIRDLGLGALSLANNHAGDFGAGGLMETLDALRAAGLGAFGAGMDTYHAVSAWYGHAKGLAIAFIGVSLADPDLLPATDPGPGLAVLAKHRSEIEAALAEARRKAQCVVVVPHWGDEGTMRLSDEQRWWARWFIDHGADAVAGSGPHVVQGCETINGAPVFYSLGNLWFQGPWPAASRVGGVAFLGLDREGRIVATRLERFQNASGPSHEAGTR